MKMLVQFLLLFLVLPVVGQNESITGYNSKDADVRQKVMEKGKNYDVNFDIENHEAFFLEGEDSLFKYLYANIIIPREALEANLNTAALIGFQVNFDGKVMNANPVQKAGYGIDEQLVNLLNGLEFVPAHTSNIAYRSEMVLEVPIKAAYIYNIRETREKLVGEEPKSRE